MGEVLSASNDVLGYTFNCHISGYIVHNVILDKT